MFPDETTAKEIRQLQHAQKIIGAILANQISDDGHYERRKTVVEMGKKDKRAEKLAKRQARKAA